MSWDDRYSMRGMSLDRTWSVFEITGNPIHKRINDFQIDHVVLYDCDGSIRVSLYDKDKCGICWAATFPNGYLFTWQEASLV